MYLTYDEFIDHDCHTNPDNGCEVCEMWFEQQIEQLLKGSDAEL